MFLRIKLEQLKHERSNLTIYALLAAAFINFLVDKPEDERKKSLLWLIEKVFGTNEEKRGFSLKDFLSEERELMQWRSEGVASGLNSDLQPKLNL